MKNQAGMRLARPPPIQHPDQAGDRNEGPLKYVPLVWAALRRKPVRTLVTFLSVTAAFILFGLMIGLNDTLQKIEERARADRIWTVGRFDNRVIPIAIAHRIARIPGIKSVSVMSYLNGYVGDPRNVAGALMADDLYGHIFTDQLSPEGWEAIRRDHTAVAMSRMQAEHFHLKVGDTYTVIAPTSVKADGSNVWTFKVAHISEDVPQVPNGMAAGSYDYYDRSMPLALQGTIAEADSVVADPAKAAALAEAIDRLFANSANPTQSTPEKTLLAVNNNFGGMDIGALTREIALIGLLMILFLIGNVIAQSVRERRAEFAALKTIGFSDAKLVALVAVEAALPCLAGAICGVLVAAALSDQLPKVMPRTFGVPPPVMSPAVYISALVSACVLALASTALPALRLRRQDIAAVLSGRA
jgi:putative ABC transport system permease protein